MRKGEVTQGNDGVRDKLKVIDNKLAKIAENQEKLQEELKKNRIK